MSLTKEFLRKAHCGVPGCTNCSHQIFLSAKCHPEAAFFVIFDKVIDSLLIICKECNGLVARVAVMENEEEYHGTGKTN